MNEYSRWLGGCVPGRDRTAIALYRQSSMSASQPKQCRCTAAEHTVGEGDRRSQVAGTDDIIVEKDDKTWPQCHADRIVEHDESRRNPAAIFLWRGNLERGSGYAGKGLQELNQTEAQNCGRDRGTESAILQRLFIHNSDLLERIIRIVLLETINGSRLLLPKTCLKLQKTVASYCRLAYTMLR